MEYALEVSGIIEDVFKIFTSAQDLNELEMRARVRYTRKVG